MSKHGFVFLWKPFDRESGSKSWSRNETIWNHKVNFFRIESVYLVWHGFRKWFRSGSVRRVSNETSSSDSDNTIIRTKQIRSREEKSYGLFALDLNFLYHRIWMSYGLSFRYLQIQYHGACSYLFSHTILEHGNFSQPKNVICINFWKK